MYRYIYIYIYVLYIYMYIYIYIYIYIWVTQFLYYIFLNCALDGQLRLFVSAKKSGSARPAEISMTETSMDMAV